MERILYEVKRIVVGQDHFLERVLVAILAQGHLLVEGVPGPRQDADGQDAGAHDPRQRSSASSSRPTSCRPTSSARASTTRRPASSTRRSARCSRNLLLADEINRAPAKVQSALLEVMQEYQVTIAGETHRVPDAVPRDGHAEPDRDRRHVSAARSAGRPLHDEGAGRLSDRGRGVRHRRARDRRSRRRSPPSPPPTSSPRCSASAARGYVDPSLIQYAVRLVAATRNPEQVTASRISARYLTYGASPRATIHLIEGARALAFLRGRDLRAARGRVRSRARRAAPSPRRCRTKRSPTRSRPTQLIQRIMQQVPRAREAAREPCPNRPKPDATPEAVLRRLEWTVIRRLDGVLHGDYRTLFRGFGLDLADLREYQYGDDVRHIDWNVTARLHRRPTCASTTRSARSPRGSCST